MSDGQHEAVSIQPPRVVRDVTEVSMEEHVTDRRERHRSAGMTRVRLLDRVHGEDADGVDG